MNMQCAVIALLTVLAAMPGPSQAADDDGIIWLVEYDGKKLPDEAAWARHGQPTAEVVDDALHIVDETDRDQGCFRAGWKADPALEIVVEARVKMGGIVGWRGGQTVWPWRDGTPAGILVGNGKHQ